MKNLQQIKHKIAIFIIIVIDTLGFGMIIPILASEVTQNMGIFSSMSVYTRHLSYGIILALVPISFVIGAIILGYFSDFLGRKRILKISMIFIFISYLLYALSFKINSLTLLIIARILNGLMTGNQSVAQAIMADNSSKKVKAKNIAIIAFAMTFGFTLSPLLGGVLSDNSYVSYFSLTTPFYFAMILILFNFILIHFWIIETNHNTTFIKIKKITLKQDLRYLFTNYIMIFYLLSFFCFELVWSLYYQSLPLILSKVFHYNKVQIGLFSAYIGFYLSIGLLVLLRLLLRVLSLRYTLIISFIIGCGSLMICYYFKTINYLWYFAIPFSIIVGLIYAILITFISDCVTSQKQGLIMGITDSILALAFALTGISSGILVYYYQAFIIFKIATGLLLLSLLFSCIPIIKYKNLHKNF